MRKCHLPRVLCIQSMAMLVSLPGKFWVLQTRSPNFLSKQPLKIPPFDTSAAPREKSQTVAVYSSPVGEAKQSLHFSCRERKNPTHFRLAGWLGETGVCCTSRMGPETALLRRTRFPMINYHTGDYLPAFAWVALAGFWFSLHEI